MDALLHTAKTRFLVAGLGALGLGVLGAFASPDQFFRSYLLGWVFWASIAVGCVPLVMLGHLTGGAWGLVIRRMLEAGIATLPFVAVGFLPILAGMESIYVWARPEAVAKDAILQFKEPYLNVPFFIARTLLYFGILAGFGFALRRWSAEQDRTANIALSRKMQVLSGPGLLISGIAVTFASVDWLMSLEPHWFSTIFGMWYLACVGLTAFAFVIILLVRFQDQAPFSEVVRPGIFHDLGKLLLAFVMVWAYLSFSQFLIIFAGNLPEEIPYYLDRSQGGWEWVALLVVLLHFVLPFVLLLSRDLKRDAGRLLLVAALVLGMRFVDFLWLIVPTFSHAHLSVHWMDLVLPVGLGGVWLALFFGRLQMRPLIPLHDPYAEEYYANAEGH